MFVNNILIYFLGGLLIIDGQLTIGSLLMFMSYMSSFSENIDAIINSITDFSSNKTVFNRLFSAFEWQDIPKEPIESDNLDINVTDVTFSYSEGGSCVLTRVSYKF